MRDTKKFSKEIISTTINHETGEIIETLDYKEKKVDAEPDFIKIYLDDIARLTNLPKGCSTVMYILLRYMTYENVIVLNSFVKKSIAENLRVDLHTLDVQISNLCQQGIMARIGRGTYLVNPNLFGKGKWQDIKNLRLTISYDRNGRTFTTERNYNQQLEIEGMESHKGIGGLPAFHIFGLS